MSRPGYDDRKELHKLWQEHARVPRGSWDSFTRALIAVANWGYDRRAEEEAGTPDGWTPYSDGTSGHQGDASLDGEHARRAKLARTLSMVRKTGSAGLTVAELRGATGWHHGMASSALSNLHRSGLVQRLVERRGGCGIYVCTEHVDGREYRSQRSAAKRDEEQG